MYRNLPADWDSYWLRCECGAHYHAADGGCYECNIARDNRDCSIDDIVYAREDDIRHGATLDDIYGDLEEAISNLDLSLIHI